MYQVIENDKQLHSSSCNSNTAPLLTCADISSSQHNFLWQRSFFSQHRTAAIDLNHLYQTDYGFIMYT